MRSISSGTHWYDITRQEIEARFLPTKKKSAPSTGAQFWLYTNSNMKARNNTVHDSPQNEVSTLKQKTISYHRARTVLLSLLRLIVLTNMSTNQSCKTSELPLNLQKKILMHYSIPRIVWRENFVVQNSIMHYCPASLPSLSRSIWLYTWQLRILMITGLTITIGWSNKNIRLSAIV